MISIKEATRDKSLESATQQILEAVNAKKCWSCGCLHTSLDAIDQSLPADKKTVGLSHAVESARKKLVPIRYDCLGCKICYPAIALNALNLGIDSCDTKTVEKRDGWPPLPGSYKVIRYQAPIAICTLVEEGLMTEIARQGVNEIALVGTLQTENLGIERLIQNILGNPNIRFLILCGKDSQQVIGHYPGQTLVALKRFGLDENSKIINAPGKRPYLKNISSTAVEYFRQTITLIDLIGLSEIPKIFKSVHGCLHQNPGPAEPFEPERKMPTLQGYLPKKMISDPAGYFVVYINREKGTLLLEHYKNDGVLDMVIEGSAAAEVYIPVIEKSLLTRLDHAAYLGRELARAEFALKTELPYIQDAAPEQSIQPKEKNSTDTETLCQEKSDCECLPIPINDQGDKS